MLKQTALHSKHVSLGAKMVPYAGFEMPVSYKSIKEEHLAVRQKVGLFDVSHMGEFVISGKDSEAFLQWVCSNDIAKMKDGRVQYNCLPNAQGGIVDDLLVYRWSATEYNVVVNAANIEKDWDWLQTRKKDGPYDVELENISEKLSLIALQGPKAPNVLVELTDVNLDSLPYYHFSSGNVAGIEDVIVSNTGYTGSGGFELYVWNKDADAVWDALLQAGERYGIAPCGLAARDTLRLEAGFCLYGNDIDDTTSPIEAGLGWITKFREPFYNASFHKDLKEKGPSKKLVGFVFKDRGIGRKDYMIQNTEGVKIGRVTSGTQSPLTGKSIGMGYVEKDYAKEGTEIYISIRKKRAKAIISSPPFFSKSEV